MRLPELNLDEFLETAFELLSVPSTADRPGELRRALESVLAGLGPGFTVEHFLSGGKPSALVYLGPTRPHFRILLNGHLDVVPAGDEGFRPRREGERLYARGAQDMKISALLMASVFRQLAPALGYPLGLQLVTDEEVGGRDGTGHQVSDGVTADFVVIGEHSGLDLVTDSKGLVHATLRATGRAGHGAYPWLGDNALLKIVRSVDRLLATYPPPAQEVWRTTVNVARIDTTNAAFNQIPADAQAFIDIRFPSEDADLTGRTKTQLRDYLAGFCEPDVEVEVAEVNAPHHADHDLAEVRALREAANAQGYRAEFLYKHGSGDGTFYAARGIPAVAFGVGGGGQHGADEYAELATFAPYHRALGDFLLRMDRPDTGTPSGG